MNLFPKLQHSKRLKKQIRLFCGAFFISLIFLGFSVGFLYISCGPESGVAEPLFSVSFSEHSPIQNSRPDSRDSCLVSFLGWKKEFSLVKLREISREILGDFTEPPSPAALLIPAPLRALAGSVLLLMRLS